MDWIVVNLCYWLYVFLRGLFITKMGFIILSLSSYGLNQKDLQRFVSNIFFSRLGWIYFLVNMAMVQLCLNELGNIGENLIFLLSVNLHLVVKRHRFLSLMFICIIFSIFSLLFEGVISINCWLLSIVWVYRGWNSLIFSLCCLTTLHLRKDL